MICTCEKCKSAFFSTEPPLFCPDCGEKASTFAGLDELVVLAILLSSGRIRESREFYDDPDANKVPPLADIVARMEALLDQIPEKTWKKYRQNYFDVRNYLSSYQDGYYYENQKKRGIPKIETSGLKLLMSLRSFLDKIEKNAPSEEPEDPEIEVEVSEEELDEAMKKMGGMSRDWVRSMLEYGKKNGLDRK